MFIHEINGHAGPKDANANIRHAGPPTKKYKSNFRIITTVDAGRVGRGNDRATDNPMSVPDTLGDQAGI